MSDGGEQNNEEKKGKRGSGGQRTMRVWKKEEGKEEEEKEEQKEEIRVRSNVFKTGPRSEPVKQPDHGSIGWTEWLGLVEPDNV